MYNKKKGYSHQGIISDNGYVDISKKISDLNKLKVTSRDINNHAKIEIGNTEIWYFDIIDIENKCSIILQFFFQTDALKKKIDLYATIFTHTPAYGIYK